MDVSSFFHHGPWSDRAPQAMAMEADMLEPALGPVGIEDDGHAVRLWTADGASFSVPKERVRVVGSWMSWLKADWNGETVLMQFATIEHATNAVEMLRPEVAVAS